MKAYLGTYTKKESQGIYLAEIENKRITKVSLAHSLDNPTYTIQRQTELFSVLKEGDQGGIAYLNNGSFINACLETGAPPCYVSVDEKHQLIYSANYHGGRVNSYALKDRRLVDVQRIVFDAGSKAHYIAWHDELDAVVVCDLGLDLVYFMKIDDQGQLHEFARFNAPQGSGPRHAVNLPHEKIVYVFAELSSQVFVLSLESQQVKLLQTVEALPAGSNAQKWGAAIRISRDGRFVYVSNRGHDSISVFAVSAEGRLSLVQNISTYGVQPRDFNLSHDDALVLVANHDTNALTLFERDADTGLLTLVQKDVWAPEAVCVDFMK
jgi:6-phosphogluconolactonase